MSEDPFQMDTDWAVEERDRLRAAEARADALADGLRHIAEKCEYDPRNAEPQEVARFARRLLTAYDEGGRDG